MLMFLLAITEKQISQNYDKKVTIEKKINNHYLTIIYESSFIEEVHKKTGITIIEKKPKIEKSNIIKKLTTVEYNDQKRYIKIYRSPLTAKPIYYTSNNKGEFFCSTHITLLRKANVPIRENRNVLPEFFVYRIVIPPLTFFNEIKQLSIGENLKIYIKDGKNISTKRFQHEFTVENKKITSLKKITKEILDVIENTYDELNLSNNEVATILSGGIDSSILTKIAQKKFGIQDSYSTGYPFEQEELNFERQYAISAAKLLGLKHNYYESTIKEYLENLINGINAVEIPVHHLQSICLFSLYDRGIPKTKTTIIEGWGAGGAFGNFRNYLYYRKKLIPNIITNPIIYPSAKKITRMIGKDDTTIKLISKSKKNIQFKDSSNPLWSYHKYGNEDWVCNYFNVSKDRIIHNQYHSIQKFENRSIYDISALYTLLGDEDSTLSIISKLGLANDKLHLFPYYDIDVLNLVFQIPWKLKLQKPESKLRKMMAKSVGIPKSIIKRPKIGFGINTKSWSLKNGIFEPMVPIAKKIFPLDVIRKVQTKEVDRAMIFWNILNYSIWQRLIIKEEPKEILMEELHENM